MKTDLKLVKITEKLSDKIYDMFQEIPYQEPTQDKNIANGLSRDDFRKYCVILEMASKNILLNYINPKTTYYVLFDKDEPIGWFLLKEEKLQNAVKHAGHIGYTIRPSKRNMGYGTIGLKMIVQKAKELKYKRVCITTDDNNFASIKMLKKNGFKKFSKNSKIQILTKSVYDKMSQYYLNLQK